MFNIIYISLRVAGLAQDFCRTASNVDKISYYIVNRLMEEIERQKIMMLTINERKTALALKTVFDELRQIEQAEAQQLKLVYQNSIPRFSALQQRSRQIIKGTQLRRDEMAHCQKYFKPNERQQIDSVIKQKTGIKGYWLKVFQHFLGEEQMSEMDSSLAAAIIDLDTRVDQHTLEIAIQFGNNKWIQPGKVTKTFLLDEGQLVSVQGSVVTWLKESQSIFANLLGRNLNREEEQEAFRLAGDLINDVVPYSVQYFLSDLGHLSDGKYQQMIEGYLEKRPTKRSKNDS